MTRVSSRTNDPKGLRGRVLDVAARSFQSRGYASTSMQDVIRDAGITGGALYHHFPTKKELALAVIVERVSADVAETWVDAVRAAPCAAVGIVTVFEQTAAALAAHGSVSGCPLGNLALELSLADKDIRSAVGLEYKTWRDAIAERLSDDLIVGRARFAENNSEAFATMVVALFSGAMGMAKVDQQPEALLACSGHLRQVMAADFRD